MIDNIVIAFGINKAWLLTGDWEMLKSGSNPTILKDVSNSRPHIDSSYAECGKPLYPLEKLYNVGLFFVYGGFRRFIYDK